MILYTGAPSTHTEDGNVVRISSKLLNILLNPAQSHHLVLQTVVTGNYCVSSAQESWTINIVLASVSVIIVTRLQAEKQRTRVPIPGNGKSFFSSPKRPDRLCGTPSLLWEPGDLPSVVKRPGREFGYSTLSSAQVNSHCVYATTPQYAFMTFTGTIYLYFHQFAFHSVDYCVNM